MIGVLAERLRLAEFSEYLLPSDCTRCRLDLDCTVLYRLTDLWISSNYGLVLMHSRLNYN